MKPILPPLTAALLALVLSPGAGAQSTDSQATAVAPVLLEQMSGNREQYIARLLTPLRRHGGQDQALEESEITVLVLSEQAKDFMLLVMSVTVFHDFKYQFWNVLGVMINFAGAIMYGGAKLFASTSS